MRILHVLNHLERLSGNVHAAVDLACAQAKSGHAVAVVARTTGDFEAILQANGVSVLHLEVRRTLPCLARAEIGLLRTIWEWQPDVVHAHMMTSAVLATPLCVILRRPLVTTVHNAFENGAIFMAVGRRIVAVSARVAENLKRRGFPHSRIRTVLNGTIGSCRFVVHAMAQKLEHPAILFVGGLHSRKGVADLLCAFAKLRNSGSSARLYLVGEGPAETSLKALAQKLAIDDRVTFCGRAEDPGAFMRGADVFVLCSHADPAPLVISEAREAGCAIVATDVDGIPEMLEHGEAGVLVPVADPTRLAAAIGEVLHSEASLAEWKRRSQLRLDNLRLQRVVDETDIVYREAIDELGFWLKALRSRRRFQTSRSYQ